MNIIQVTPANKKSKNGNRTTAVRWARLLRNLGHRVKTVTEYDGLEFGGGGADMMIAIHAWRSASAISEFKSRYPDRPLVLCLGGTDINLFIHSHPEPTLRSMDLADQIVCLHDLIRDITPERHRKKLSVIYQSAKPLSRERRPGSRYFDVLVAGHMREVKDPMRAALAVRDLPQSSKIRVIHLGKSHDKKSKKMATDEMKRNPRYLWKGEVPGWKVRQEYSHCQLMAITSTAEGGANVVSESIVAGLPIIASDVGGNIGLLGRRYSGYYPVGDEEALRDVLLKAENDPEFLEKLTRQCVARRAKFSPEQEQENWRNLIGKFK